ncbi:hypothetical protein H6F89_33470 [Cyanobacteria bacterium FACHB-63]|nr:hypothetical protein [Cyanobacteria bacterium FACHB-63]
MSSLSQYWNIWRMSLATEHLQYKCYSVSLAQEFIQAQFLNSLTPEASLKPQDIEAALLANFRVGSKNRDPIQRAQAGLCLRCYVSEAILKACRKIDYLFGHTKAFTYQDLLPFVLNDDGKTAVILDLDQKTQLRLDDQGQLHPMTYKFFSVEILKTYQIDASSRMSLENWAYLQTRQNPELKAFLAEFGFQHLSDWALLNRVRPAQLERLSEHDRHLVEVFHVVYRRDRRRCHQPGAKKSADPSWEQCQEMINRLRNSCGIVSTPNELIKLLKQIAVQLKECDIWKSREPLEIYHVDNQSYVTRSDLPHTEIDELDIEQQEFLEFIYQQLQVALVQAIDQELGNRLDRLHHSRRYASLADRFIPGLQLYYTENKSLKEVAPLLGMTSWDQARRVLNPGDLLHQIRTRTIQHLLNLLLKKAQAKGFAALYPSPDYLTELAAQIEAFADQEVFQEAVEEIKAGKQRSLNSPYAQQLRTCLNDRRRREDYELSSLSNRV